MQPTTSSPFALVRTFVFRRYIKLHNFTVSASVATLEAEAARKARKRLKKQAKHERMRNFFGWCEGCAAFGSIF